MKKSVILSLSFLIMLSFVGCVFNDLDSGSDVSTVSDPIAPDKVISSIDPVASTSEVAAELTALLNELKISQNFRAQVSSRVLSAATLPIPDGVPDLANSVISLSSSLSPTLNTAVGGLKIETITDAQAFLSQHGITVDVLKVLIKNAKAVAIDLNNFTDAQALNNPFIAAAISQAVPVIFENTSALIAKNRNSFEAQALAEKMATALGLGFEGHIVVAVPAENSSELDLITLGFDGFAEAINESSLWETEDPADEDGETPEASVSLAPSVRASGEDPFILRPELQQSGLPATGELPENYYKGFRIRPYKATSWKPDSNQTFRNNISYYVQLGYSTRLNVKYLRIFTDGMFEMVDGKMHSDSHSRRGYFQFSHSIKIQPVGNDNDDYQHPAWLSLVSASPDSHTFTDGNDQVYQVSSSFEAGDKAYRRQCITEGFPGFKVEKFAATHRGKWKFKLIEGWKSISSDSSGEQWNSYNHPTNKDYRKISRWKDMFWVREDALDKILILPPHAHNDFQPSCQVVYTAANDCTQKQRFLLRNVQGVRTVWRGTYTGSFNHDEVFKKKFRHVTVDFSKVSP